MLCNAFCRERQRCLGPNQVATKLQWRRQRSKGARSFRGQKILQPGHLDALFSSKELTTLFSCRPQNTGRQRRFTVKKQLKRSDMVTFLFCVHTITDANNNLPQCCINCTTSNNFKSHIHKVLEPE